MTGKAALAASFRRFAERECAGVSPLYHALSREIVRCPSCGKEICSTAITCHHCGADTRGGSND